MSNHSVNCNGAVCDAHGKLFSIPVYYDGESFYSFLFSESDVSGISGENIRDTLLEKPVWFTDLWRSPKGRLCVSDADGILYVGNQQGFEEEQVCQEALNTVWGLNDETIFAGGDDGIVYIRQEGNWSELSHNLGGKILCIRGTSLANLYACGEDALFWHYDGSIWNQIELPTNSVLVGILCKSETEVVVCGEGGSLFEGHGADWRDNSIPNRSLYKIEAWKDRTFVAAGGDGILELIDGNAVPIKDNIVAYRLSSCSDYLATAGGDLAARFDGVGWFGARYA